MCRAHDECATQVWLAPNRILEYAGSRQEEHWVADNAPCLSVTHMHTETLGLSMYTNTKLHKHTLQRVHKTVTKLSLFVHSLFITYLSVSFVPHSFVINVIFTLRKEFVCLCDMQCWGSNLWCRFLFTLYFSMSCIPYVEYVKSCHSFSFKRLSLHSYFVILSCIVASLIWKHCDWMVG